jgi:hypothetical protein
MECRHSLVAQEGDEVISHIMEVHAGWDRGRWLHRVCGVAVALETMDQIREIGGWPPE